MDALKNIYDMNYRVSIAKANAPNDVLTKTALFLIKMITSSFIILTPIQVVTTGLGGCLIAVTFGLFVFVLTVIWWPFLALLLATSWLWLHAWYLRPLLIIPGILIAVIADLYVMLAPEPERDAKYSKLSLAGEWPLTWLLFKPPAKYYRKDPFEESQNQTELNS